MALWNIVTNKCCQKNTPTFYSSFLFIVCVLCETKQIQSRWWLNTIACSKISKDWHKSKCVPYGETTTQVDERKGGFLLVCTCNSHRLSEKWRGPGHGALSALMMRQLEAIFQLGQALTLKHFWSTLPGRSMTKMDGTTAMLTIHSNLIWWLYRPNAVISLTLGYLPWSAEAESSPLVKKWGLSLRDRESFLFDENIMLK